MGKTLWKKLFRTFLVLMVAMVAYAAAPVSTSEVQAATNGFKTVNGKTYFYKNGKKQSGWITYKGKKYYFYSGSKTMATGWLKNSKGQKRYFSKKTGAMLTGFQTINKKKYYFYSNSGVMATGWLKNSKGQKRYFGSNGVMRTGFQTISKKTYYFYSSTGIMGTGWMTNSKGQKRYFGSNGVMRTGFQTINKKTYYFYSSSGIMGTGWMSNSKGQKRYFGTNGVMRTGFQTISSKKYYFNSSGIAQTGLKTISGKKYYFNSSGVMQTGWQTISSQKYYFGSDGVMYADTTAAISGVKYAFDDDGIPEVIIDPEDVKITDAQLDILVNIIGAVESGGQVYGKQNYSLFVEAYTNSSIEHAITIGAFQEYGANARNLLLEILKAYPEVFRKYDTAEIEEDLEKSWDNYRIEKDSKKAKAIVKIISTPEGIEIQNKRIKALLKEYIAFALKKGVTNTDALFMCANWIHQGGQAACTRLLGKVDAAGKSYTLDNLYAACQTDTGNQVGAYKTRQAKVYAWLKEKL